MKLRFGPAIFTIIFGLAGCGESEQPAPAGGTRIAVSDMPNSQYYLLSNSVTANGHREALIQENGRNGLQTFMRYEVDCAGQRMTQLGRGGTAEAAQRGEGAQADSLDARSGSLSEFRGAVC
ncbi:MAG: hypothetical protein ACXWUR_03195 [Allosphingosinicella sp.]